MANITISQQVAASPTQVYAAFMSADALAGWWWPHIADAAYQVDARVGGRYQIRSAAAGIGVRGVFLTLDEPECIRLTWNWMNDGVSQVQEEVEIRFTPQQGGTLVQVVHFASPLAGESEGLRQGWHDVLARLAQVCSQGLSLR